MEKNNSIETDIHDSNEVMDVTPNTPSEFQQEKPTTNNAVTVLVLVVLIISGVIIGRSMFLSTRIPEVLPTPTQIVTYTAIPTESAIPTLIVTPTVIATQPVETGEKYSDSEVSLTIPKGWKKVLANNGKNLLRLEKNNYYFYATWGIITGGGFGYPYDGVCLTQGATKSSTSLPKLGSRYDTYFNLSKNKTLDPDVYGDAFKTEAESCMIKPSIQKGNIVWLGSRYGTSDVGTSADTYFNVKSGSSVELFVQYSHKNIEDSNITDGPTYAFPALNSTELKTMIAEMDEIAKTVVFKKALLNQ